MSIAVPLDNFDASPRGSGGSPHSPHASDFRSRIMFGAFLIVGFIIGLLLQNNIVDWIVKWAIDKDGDCSSTNCVGHQGAYRVSFALFVFFLVHYLFSHSCNCCLDAEQRVGFNGTKMMFVRVIAFVAVLLVTFVIPNPFFTYYAWFALVVSCIYLIGQLVLILHFAYEWNENWRNRDEDRFTYGLLGCTTALFVAGLVVLGYLFKWFGNDASCSTGQGILTVTLLCAVLYTALALRSPHGSLLPSSVVFAYTVWLAYSGLSSGIAPSVCNTIDSTGTTQMIVAAIVSALSLAIAATNAGLSKDAFETAAESDNGPLSASEVAANSFQFFHFMMTMGSCYLAMLLTSWAITGSEGIAENADSGTASMWVKLSSELLCIALYVWTLAAPMLFPDRTFG